MKIFEDYDLADLFKQYVDSDVYRLSPKIEPDKNTEKYKLRTYEYDKISMEFDTQKPVHLYYGSLDECLKVLNEFKALLMILKDYNLTCDIIRAKYINPNSSKAMKKSALYRKYNLKEASINEKEELLSYLEEDIIE